jgi:hypothetical protein
MSPNWQNLRLLIAAVAGFFCGDWTQAMELPTALMERLKSEKFAEREQAEAELLLWARQDQNASTELLYQQSRTAEDPEVRERCFSVLRQLVTDEYLRVGVGYIGILMNPITERVNIPGENQPWFAIKILQVVPDSPAHKAGMIVGDLLLGVDGTVWQQEHTSAVVSDKIKSLKAGTRIAVKLLRDDKILDVPLVLARRPAEDQLPQFGFGIKMTPEAAAAAERAATEKYFRNWLAQRKPKE